MDERPLIDRVLQSGDREAFSALVVRHQSMVRGFLRRLCRGDDHRADDLAQETFLTAYRRLARFDTRRRFNAWLLGIAHNHYRNQRRRFRPAERWDAAAHDTAVPERTEARLARIDLEEAMRALPPDEVAALTLCYQNDLSHEEAASAMGVPLGTLKSWVLRGRQRLREQLQERNLS